MRSQFRGVLEWMHEGNPMSTPSNNACKMYDAALTQVVGWYTDPNLNGVEETLKIMEKEDPEFVMGKCLTIGVILGDTGRHPKNNLELSNRLRELNELVQKTQRKLSPRELSHVKAVNEWAEGNLKGAADIWQQILLEHPTDMHAIRLAQDAYFFLGEQMRMRDSIARVLPFWQSSSIPLKNYLHGMYAFGLQETNFYEKARSEAKFALERNPSDGWATHALAHVHDMLGEIDSGIRFYEQTEPNWTRCDLLNCHNYWHWALYLLEKNEFDSAFDLYTQHIEKPAMKNDSVFNCIDASSFLYRLELLDNRRRTEEWRRIYSKIETHLDDHVYGFNETHYAMACLGAGLKDQAYKLLSNLDSGSETFSITNDVIDAMIEFEQQNYSKATNLLSKGQYDWIHLGGSNAQRDVYHQLMVVSAIRSPDDHHRRLAERLIIERSQFREKSAINQLLVDQLNTRKD